MAVRHKIQRRFGILALTTWIVCGPQPGFSAGDPAIVWTSHGSVRGVIKEGVREFLGIPYAAPPIGALRWKPPREHSLWSATLDAGEFRGACPQISSGGLPLKEGESEDCLYLNIYTPNPPKEHLPVLVWIHGGAFVEGAGSLLDGSAIAAKGSVVTVTINYRLGPLGFLAHPALDAENPDHSSGNYGLLDQQAALRWVKTNIAPFGGDPAKVTAAGQSAGATSVCLQMMSPLGAGLFQRAIMESGRCVFQQPQDQAERVGDQFAAKLGCAKARDVAACMRSKSVKQALATLPANPLGDEPPPWMPTMNGPVLPMQPFVALHSGQYQKMPILYGSNHDEGTIFVASDASMSANEYTQRLKADLGPRATLVQNEYPLDQYASPAEANAAELGDWLFSCIVHRAVARMSQSAPVYEYEFNDRDAPYPEPRKPQLKMGAYHGSEVRYAYHSVASESPTPLSPSQQKLSDDMMSYWIRFIQTGDPGGRSPRWTPYRSSDDKVLSFAPGAIGYESNFVQEHHCDLWSGMR